MKRFIATILSIALMCSFIPAAFAASDKETQAAQALYDLGLFQGTGNNADGTPNFDLDRAPTRAEAVTMLVRLLGKDAEAKAESWTTPFTDVADWAKPYVGYAYTNGLTTGTSATTFGGEQTIDATQYLTFVLRALGYTSGTDFQWDSAWTKSDEIKLTDGHYNADTTSFTRGDVAEISYNALSTQKKNEAQSLGATLGIDKSSGAKNVLSTESLQGIWQFENGTSSGDPDSIYYEEFTFEGDNLTYVRYYGSRSTGEFGTTKISAIDYKVGTFTVEDDNIVFNITKYTDTLGTEVHDFGGRTEKYVVSNFTGDVFHCNTDGWRVGVCRKVSEASRTRYAETLIEKLEIESTKSLTSSEKQDVADSMNRAKETVQTSLKSIKADMRSAQLLLLGGLTPYQRQLLEKGMQATVSAYPALWAIVDEEIKEVREILEKKSGTDDLVAKMEKLERLCQSIADVPFGTDPDTLMDLSEKMVSATELFTEIYNDIADKYFE